MQFYLRAQAKVGKSFQVYLVLFCSRMLGVIDKLARLSGLMCNCSKEKTKASVDRFVFVFVKSHVSPRKHVHPPSI